MGRFENIGDISFMGNITLAELKKIATNEYLSSYADLTGNNVEISDEIKAILYAAAQIFYQLAETIDTKARQNLLKYSSGEYLDNLALSKGLVRKQQEPSVVTIRFTLSATRQNVVAIPKGTRVTSQSNKIYFETTDYDEILPGAEYADIQCVSTTGGVECNQFEIGELNRLVDPIAYVSSVTNIDEPTGGADEETDDDFAMRIFDARNLFSTAGSENAYIYYTKSYSTLIDDVIVTNPQDAEIYIYILMTDRNEATPAFIEGLTEYLSSDDIRPLTDKITVKNVERIQYSIDIEYTIYETDISKLSDIEKSISEAVENYKKWQCAKIGRDINNQKLVSVVIAAGAANVKVKSPTNTQITPIQIAYCSDINIVYKGYVEE